MFSFHFHCVQHFSVCYGFNKEDFVLILHVSLVIINLLFSIAVITTDPYAVFSISLKSQSHEDHEEEGKYTYT